MKLDKIKFAKLIGYIVSELEKPMFGYQIEAIDEMIDVDVPQPDVAYPSVSDVNKLMELMAAGTHKIEAIKLHRKLTGWGLKESKDQVEKYWVSKDVDTARTVPACFDKSGGPANETLGDILATAIK